MPIVEPMPSSASAPAEKPPFFSAPVAGPIVTR